MAKGKLNYYGLVPNGNGTFTVYAVDPHAQQLFFGWGSDRNRIEGAFYGNDARGSLPVKLKGKLAPGDMPWKWVLGPEHARTMLDLVERHGDDPHYYDANEKKRLPDLVATMKLISGEG